MVEGGDITITVSSVFSAGGDPLGTPDSGTHTGGGMGLAPVSSATPPGGYYQSSQSVTLSCDAGGGASCQAIHYTLDGSTPTSGSPVYSVPLVINTDTTLTFFAVDSLGHAEEVHAEDYFVDAQAPAVTIVEPASGFAGAVSTIRGTSADGTSSPDGTPSGVDRVELKVTDGTNFLTSTGDWTGAETWIAASGTTAWSLDTASVVWTLYETYTVTARAFDQLNNMGQASVQFTYEGDTPDTAAPTSTAFPPSGAYASAQTVNIVCNDSGGSGCAATYYTLDGTAPTTGSTPYTDPIAVTVSTTLRYFSRDRAGNSETPKTETYTIEDPGAPQVDTPSFAPDPGGYRSAQNVTPVLHHAELDHTLHQGRQRTPRGVTLVRRYTDRSDGNHGHPGPGVRLGPGPERDRPGRIPDRHRAGSHAEFEAVAPGLMKAAHGHFHDHFAYYI